MPLLASQQSNLTIPNTWTNKDLTLGTNRQLCGTHHRVYLMRTHDNPTKSKTTCVDIKEVFLVEECNSFHLSGEETSLPPPEGLSLNTNVNCTWSNHWLHHNARSLLPTTPRTIDFAIEIGLWTTICISRDTRLYHFCSYNVAENEAHFMLECPLYKAH